MFVSDNILILEIFKYFKISSGIFGFRRYPNMQPISPRYPHTAVSRYILLSKQPLVLPDSRIWSPQTNAPIISRMRIRSEQYENFCIQIISQTINPMPKQLLWGVCYGCIFVVLFTTHYSSFMGLVIVP